MNLDWSARLSLREECVVFLRRTVSAPARVTVGMPTFRRASTIRRALASLAAQSFREFVLVVSDNGGRDPETLAAVEEFADRLPEVILYAQDTNLGALPNLHFLLASASTPYFMWLADDDEISADYIEELVALLDADANAATAAGRWETISPWGGATQRKQLENESPNRAIRAFRHVAFADEDSAFYGLHRTECMRRTHFPGYLPPNRGVLTNWCYLFLFEMILQGRLRHATSATWRAFNDVPKAYAKAKAGGLRNKLRTLARRLNLYALYVAKSWRYPLLVPLVVLASFVGLIRDIVTAIARVLTRLVLGKKRTK